MYLSSGSRARRKEGGEGGEGGKQEAGLIAWNDGLISLASCSLSL